MNQEHARRNIEIKARVKESDVIRAAARALPAREVGVMRQVDTYFHVPHGRLKLREIAGKGAELIFYDRPDQGPAKASQYWIAPIAESAPLLAALTAALGVRARVEKTRRLLLYRHTRIHLDTVTGMGEFVELETVLDGLGEEEGRRESTAVMRALGIADEDLLPYSYGDMVLFPPSVPTC